MEQPFAKPLPRSNLNTSKNLRPMKKRRTQIVEVKKVLKQLEKYFNEELDRKVPKDTVEVNKITKQKDEKELFKLTDLVVGVALLGKNKDNVKRATDQLDRRNPRKHSRRSLTM